mmetsp:Transcript_81182/g.224700  ORF Transcript_81182/g.224700 Transcript_81182/m.224700 type:complete len:236 (-) Transcript_81182:180-887(-)
MVGCAGLLLESSATRPQFQAGHIQLMELFRSRADLCVQLLVGKLRLPFAQLPDFVLHRQGGHGSTHLSQLLNVALVLGPGFHQRAAQCLAALAHGLQLCVVAGLGFAQLLCHLCCALDDISQFRAAVLEFLLRLGQLLLRLLPALLHLLLLLGQCLAAPCPAGLHALRLAAGRGALRREPLELRPLVLQVPCYLLAIAECGGHLFTDVLLPRGECFEFQLPGPEFLSSAPGILPL